MDENTSTPALVQLGDVEARVLGCLIEKQAFTPETYPLTLNAAVVAANQKSNREPLMELDPGVVGHALRQLEDKGLVRVAHGSRTLRYEHRVDEALVLTARQRAVLCVLLLRGAQTQNELLLRTERLAKFAGPDELRETLERMASRSPALVVCIGRAPGQREDRWTHLLCGPVSAEMLAAHSTSAAPRETPDEGLEQRVAQLEAEVAALRADLDSLLRG